MAIIRNITMANKDHLNLIITGHIDNGKSTTMGHFLMDLGVVDERTMTQAYLKVSPLPIFSDSSA